MINKKGQLTANKTVIAVISVLVLAAVLMFIFKARIGEWMAGLPGVGEEAGKDIVVDVDPRLRMFCPYAVAKIHANEISYCIDGNPQKCYGTGLLWSDDKGGMIKIFNTVLGIDWSVVEILNPDEPLAEATGVIKVPDGVLNVGEEYADIQGKILNPDIYTVGEEYWFLLALNGSKRYGETNLICRDKKPYTVVKKISVGRESGFAVKLCVGKDFENIVKVTNDWKIASKLDFYLGMIGKDNYIYINPDDTDYNPPIDAPEKVSITEPPWSKKEGEIKSRDKSFHLFRDDILLLLEGQFRSCLDDYSQPLSNYSEVSALRLNREEQGETSYRTELQPDKWLSICFRNDFLNSYYFGSDVEKAKKYTKGAPLYLSEGSCLNGDIAYDIEDAEPDRTTTWLEIVNLPQVGLKEFYYDYDSLIRYGDISLPRTFKLYLDSSLNEESIARSELQSRMENELIKVYIIRRAEIGEGVAIPEMEFELKDFFPNLARLCEPMDNPDVWFSLPEARKVKIPGKNKEYTAYQYFLSSPSPYTRIKRERCYVQLATSRPVPQKIESPVILNDYYIEHPYPRNVLPPSWATFPKEGE